MLKKEIVVGSMYAAKKEYGNNIYYSTKDGKVSDRTEIFMPAETLLLCKKINVDISCISYPYNLGMGSLFEVKLSSREDVIGKIICCFSYGFLKMGYKEGSKEERLARIIYVRNKIKMIDSETEKKEKEIQVAKETVDRNKDLSKKLKDRISKLEKYSSDEDEIAATISEIIKSGGETSQIAHILKGTSIFIEKMI